jgi:hypothetical protein
MSRENYGAGYVTSKQMDLEHDTVRRLFGGNRTLMKQQRHSQKKITYREPAASLGPSSTEAAPVFHHVYER